MEDFELFPDETEEAAAEEGSNRTFIILVAVFGGILAIGICAFIVWAVVIYPQIQKATAANAGVEQTAIVLTADAETAANQVESTKTSEPTKTPLPPTQEPTKVPPTATATPAEVAEAATEEPTPTHRPTVTPKPTATSGASGDKVPTTGVGVFGAGGIVVALLVILVAARRLRRPA
jgi:cytoskeletal protein RodZ